MTMCVQTLLAILDSMFMDSRVNLARTRPTLWK